MWLSSIEVSLSKVQKKTRPNCNLSVCANTITVKSMDTSMHAHHILREASVLGRVYYICFVLKYWFIESSLYPSGRYTASVIEASAISRSMIPRFLLDSGGYIIFRDLWFFKPSTRNTFSPVTKFDRYFESCLILPTILHSETTFFPERSSQQRKN